jgi:hypothetical protein
VVDALVLDVAAAAPLKEGEDAAFQGPLMAAQSWKRRWQVGRCY